MSNRYHINPDTGRANQCGAKIKCRFGADTEHYDTKESAQKAFENSMSSETVSQSLKKAVAPRLITPISDATADEIDSKTRLVSGGVVGVSPGTDFGDPNTIMAVSFNCEHDLYLMIEKDKNGDKWGYEAYGYDPRPTRKPLDQILTPSTMWDLGGENENYPYEMWEEDRDTHKTGVEVVKIINDFLVEYDSTS